MLQNYVVYADVLFVLNFTLDCFLLWATGKFMRIKINIWRLLAASALGGFYGLGILFAQLSALYSLPLTILFSLLMIAAAFPVRNFAFLLKTSAVLYIIGFAMAGAALGGQAALSGWDGDTLVKTGVLLFSLCIAVIVARWGMRQYRRNWRKETFKAELEIHMNDRVCNITALIDTGNELVDPLTGKPAVIAEVSSMSNILPAGLMREINNHGTANPSKVMSECDNILWRRRLRMLPFNSIGNANGMLLGFKPDLLVIKSDENNAESIGTNDVIICFSLQRLGNSMGCRAIINPAVLNNSRIKEII